MGGFPTAVARGINDASGRCHVKNNLSRLRVQQFVAVVPLIIAEVQEITQAGTGITLALSGHSVVGRLENDSSGNGGRFP